MENTYDENVSIALLSLTPYMPTVSSLEPPNLRGDSTSVDPI